MTDPEDRISTHFGEYPHFLLTDIDTKEKLIVQQKEVGNPLLELKKGKGIKVAQFLLDHNPDVVFSREDLSGKGPCYVLADAGVKTRQTDNRKLDELLNRLLLGIDERQEMK